MNLTWRQLATIINDLPETNKDDNVTVYDGSIDEYFPVPHVMTADEDHGVLDEGHLFLCFGDE